MNLENKRFARGKVLAASSKIRRVSPVLASQLWKVESEVHPNTFYDVVQKSNGDIFCTCPDYKNRGEPCKHIFGVIISEVSVK